MEVYSMRKLKRKDLEDFSVDFSDFSLSYPPRKTRRTDAEPLPPILEGDAPKMYEEFEKSPVEVPIIFYSSSRVVKIEEISSSEILKEESAVVLFKPYNAGSNPDDSNSFTPQILSRFKNQIWVSGESKTDAPSFSHPPRFDDLDMMDDG